MKTISLLIAMMLTGFAATAQYVGIGTSTPQTTLDVKGNQRIGGVSSYMSYDSVTGRFEWRNSNLYVPVTQALIKHSAAADGLFYNNTAPVSGQLEYRNASGEPVFYTNFTNGNGYFKNYLGIGTTYPFTNLQIESDNQYPVIINGAPSLYISWAEENIYRGYLGSYAGNPEDVDFGTYSGNATGKIHFTTQAIPKMTINASGNVGIGTENPGSRLHVISGASGYSGGYFPGITLEGSNNTYLNIITPAGFESSVLFGRSTDAAHGGIVYNNPSTPNGLQFRTNGNVNRMAISNTGNVGIGILVPTEKLEVSGNIKASAYKYNTAKTYYYSIDQSAFTARDGIEAVQKTFGSGGAFVLNGSDYGITAPVNLPHGASITKISIGFYDVVAAQDLQAKFYRFHATAGVGFLSNATLTSTGSAGLQTITHIFPTPLIIDNSIFGYSIVVFPTSGNWTNSNLMVKGLVIEYTVSEL